MMAQKASSGQNFIKAALIGDLGAIVGSIVSVRLMLIKTKKYMAPMKWQRKTVRLMNIFLITEK